MGTEFFDKKGNMVAKRFWGGDKVGMGLRIFVSPKRWEKINNLRANSHKGAKEEKDLVELQCDLAVFINEDHKPESIKFSQVLFNFENLLVDEALIDELNVFDAINFEVRITADISNPFNVFILDETKSAILKEVNKNKVDLLDWIVNGDVENIIKFIEDTNKKFK